MPYHAQPTPVAKNPHDYRPSKAKSVPMKLPKK